MGKNMHTQTESLTLNQFFSWVKEAFSPSYQSEVETYLAQATDLADLEQRMHTLARRGML
jgi:hypothetical protein